MHSLEEQITPRKRYEPTVDGRNPAPLGAYKTLQLEGWRRISAINSIMTPVCKSTLIVPKDAQRFNSKCFIWESFSSSALAAFSSSLDGSCLNDSKINRPSFGRNRGWNTWEYTEYSIYQTGWDMSHYVPPILNFVKELHVAKQHPSRWLSLCQSSKVKTDHFRVLLPFQDASPLASFFSSPFSSRTPPLTTHPTKASARFLASALEGEGDFLAWQKAGTNEMVQGMKMYPMRNHFMKLQMHPITH